MYINYLYHEPLCLLLQLNSAADFVDFSYLVKIRKINILVFTN